ncbi:MAG: ATP-binding protein [bacterium]|nr:ATP-binding protein [bacterium]
MQNTQKGTTSALGQANPNPFSPGFGQLPAMLVGRDDLLAELGTGLVTGPRDPRYTSLLLGVRGSGKTVLLTEIEDRAASDGWIVISVDAGTNSLLERIQDEIQSLPERYPDIDLSRLTDSRTVEKTKSIDIGVFKGEITEAESNLNISMMGLRRQLTYLAEQAQTHNTAVILTVDELHAVERNEGRRLSNDLQHITKRDELPLAFIGAGLSEMKYTIMQDKKMTFFQRCQQYDMPALSEAEVTKGLLHPIKDSGGNITDNALNIAVESTASSPYKLQLLGHSAWTVANAPTQDIDTLAVRQAARLAQKQFDEKISEPAFYDLSDSERCHLRGLVDLGGEAKIVDIARQTGQNPDTAYGINRRLTLSGYLERVGNLTRLTDLVPERIILKELGTN